MPETSDLTVRIRAIDEATPVIQNIASELAELEIHADPWPKVASLVGLINFALLLALIFGR